MKTPRRLIGTVALALSLASCVSLEDTHLPRGGVLKDQRTVVAVFAGPGPVMGQDDNKAESAAKITPGLAYIVQSAQDDRDLAASKDLAQYLPVFDAAKEFETILTKALPQAGHPGVFLAPSDAAITDDQLKAFNKASDILDWRLRYYIPSPDHPLPRNYSTFLQLDDALIFEVNLAYGVVQDDQQNSTPNLSALVKLFRVGTMRMIWNHEVSVEDRPGARLLYDFKREPGDLIGKYRKLMPLLSQKIVEDYKRELQAANLYMPPAGTGSPLSTSTAAAAGAPAGWYPAPALPARPEPAAPANLPLGLSMSTTTAAALGLSTTTAH